MEQELGRFRLYAMRVIFLLTAIALIPSTFEQLFISDERLLPLETIAMSFWLALGFLSVLGLLYPLALLPILIMQFAYKLIWLAAVGLPMWLANDLEEYRELFMANGIGLVLDAIVIPWFYVFKQYFKKPQW